MHIGKNAACVLLMVLAGCVSLVRAGWFSSNEVVYVSIGGSNWYSGSSVAYPLRSIQLACDRATPGTKIIILPGSYHERIHLRRSGTREKPIELLARDPGTVTISQGESGWLQNAHGNFVERTSM